jgi:bifunctional UDP-N-acetylglucosamine pyrophosphorylase/glucosamine-1-phosphate N-acetyltransferase
MVLEQECYLKRIIEKPTKIVSYRVNTGLYVLNSDIFAELSQLKKSKRQEYELVEALNSLANSTDIKCVDVSRYWQPLVYGWNLLDLNKTLLADIKPKQLGEIEPYATLKHNVSIDKGTLIRNGAYIEGPVIIGKNCTIGPNCYIRPYTSIGDDCKIGNGVEVKNSVLFNKVSVGHLSYIGDSIIANDVNIGAGTITANLRHDNSNIKSVVNNELVDTSRRKFGTIIGENVKTGINTLIYPGRKIWPNKTTLPGDIVKLDIT